MVRLKVTVQATFELEWPPLHNGYRSYAASVVASQYRNKSHSVYGPSSHRECQFVWSYLAMAQDFTLRQDRRSFFLLALRPPFSEE